MMANALEKGLTSMNYGHHLAMVDHIKDWQQGIQPYVVNNRIPYYNLQHNLLLPWIFHQLLWAIEHPKSSYPNFATTHVGVGEGLRIVIDQSNGHNKNTKFIIWK